MTTNEQQHTPEPWDGSDSQLTVNDAVLATFDRSYIGKRTNAANALRAAECVNACEGMADPAVIIEMLQACAGQVPDMGDAIAARDQTIADLVAVLGASTRKIQAMCKSGHSAPPFDQLSFDRQVGVNEHAIAKAKAVLS